MTQPLHGDCDGDGAVRREQARRRERRYFIRFAAGVTAIVLFGLIAGLLVAVADNDDGLSNLQPGDWALIVGLPLGVTLLIAAVAIAVAFWRRRRGSALFAPSPLWELRTQKQRRELVRALRRGQPIDPVNHDLARRVAHDTTQRRGLIWLYVFVAATQGVNAIIQDSWGRWFSLASAVLFLSLSGYFAWLIRRMHHALRQLDDATSSNDPTSET